MERGGPTVQAGIAFQNDVAAFFLAELVSFEGGVADRVVEVRVEAPAHVDDVVVDYADGHRHWVQAKLALTAGSAAWVALWQAFAAQVADPRFGQRDRLQLVLGRDTALAEILSECCRRTKDADEGEWRSRMTVGQRDQVIQIETVLGESAHGIFARLDVIVEADAAFSDERLRRRLPPSNVQPRVLHEALSSLAGRGAARRTIFRAADLAATLRDDFAISIEPPADWGLQAYLTAVAAGTIAVPGTAVGGSANDIYVWPRTARTAVFRRDFDDEQVLDMLANAPPAIDFRIFPSPELSQAVVHAGPGFGKSALLAALSQRLALEAAFVPVIIPLAALEESGREVVDFLNVNVNAEHGVRIDWERLVETGVAVVFFDGLDEVALPTRSAVVARVARFMTRRRGSPWLLTVRDAALVPAQLDAQKVELLPLLDDEMSAFVRTIRPDLHDNALERMSRQFDAYPEIRRLARIPLFLALMAAMLDQAVDLPRKRGDLIEAYLKTLFRPEEHKETARAADPELLRRVLQELAFDLLTAGSIGAEERTVRRLFARRASQEVSAERLFDDAVRCGVLHRQTSTRLSFPFPIVQEYLAAQELLDQRPQEVAAMVAGGVDRPWAQTIQFALEGLEDTSAMIRQLLAAGDDVFASRARLIARCVVNGMRCEQGLRDEIGSRLVSAWPDQGFWTERRIGQLLHDGWTHPLFGPLRQALHNRGLFHGGGELILADIADDALTMSVLPELLKTSFWTVHLGDFQRAVNRVSEAAFELYLDIWSSEPPDENRAWRLASLIRRLDGAGVSSELLDRISGDASYPICIRLATLQLRTEADQDLIKSLIVQAFQDAEARDGWMACQAISFLHHPEAMLQSLLRRGDLDPAAHETIVDHIADALPQDGPRMAFLRSQALLEDLSEQLRLSIRLKSMTLGDREAYAGLVAEFAELPEDCLRSVIWCVNKSPDTELGEKLITAMRARITDPADRAAHVGDLIIGATHDVDVFSRSSASMDPSRPHPSYASFIALVSEWRDEGGFALADHLRFEAVAAKVHLPGAHERLLDITSQALSVIDLEDKEAPLTLPIEEALRNLAGFPEKIPLSAVSRLFGAKDENLRSDAASYIASVGTREALDMLLDQARRRIVYRSNLMAAIETAANRIGARVVDGPSGLHVASDG